MQQKVWRYKKKLWRKNERNGSLSPRSEINKVVEGKFVDPEVKKKLFFAEAVKADLQSMKTVKSKKVKQVLAKTVQFKFLKKYKLLKDSKAFMFTKLYRRLQKEQNNNSASDPMKYDQADKKSCISNRQTVRDFFLRDDVTSVSPGKGRRNYLKCGGLLKRKRILRGTLSDLYEKFCKDKTIKNKVSFSSFCRLKPFYVVAQGVEDRRTCMCQQCANFSLLCQALNTAGAIAKRKSIDVIQLVCCSEITEQCLERKCLKCNSKMLPFQSVNKKKLVDRFKWVTVSETKKGVDNPVKKVKKKLFKETILSLKTELIDLLLKYMGHYCRNLHQQETIQNLKKNAGPGDLVIHMDFSENYSCKYKEEIQSFYYVGSRENISIHQGVARSEKEKKAFCTLSVSPRHDAAAIGAHLLPIMDYFLTKYPEISCVHFCSDSPVTQYRNKESFFLTTRVLPSLYPQITNVTYNFSEAGHGKNESDGVGGWAKTTADTAVSNGEDIADLNALVNLLKMKTEKTFIDTVHNSDILAIEKLIPKDLSRFVGTMKVHFYSWTKENPKAIFFSTMSCYVCPPGTACSHFSLPGCPWKSVSEQESQLNLQGKSRLHVDYGTTDEQCTNSHQEPEQSVNSQHIVPAGDEVQLAVGAWVAVIYNSIWYPGFVEKVTKQYVIVNFMVRHETSDALFLWPTADDKQRIKKSDVLYILHSPPVPTSRVLFSIPELEKINLLASAANSLAVAGN